MGQRRRLLRRDTEISERDKKRGSSVQS